MKVPYLSASRLRIAKDCSLQYEYHYDPQTDDALALKWKSNHRDNMQAARVGTNIHNALEVWRAPGGGRRTYPRLISLYDAENSKNEVDFNFYEDGKRMLSRWFDRRGRSPIRVIDTERSFGSHKAPHILSNDVPVFGFIDCIVEHKDGTIELIDYKSQRAPMTQAEADNSIQAGIYLVVARELFPGKPLRFTFDLLRYGAVTTTWSEKRLDDYLVWLKAQYDWLITLDKGIATIGKGCMWCAYSEICPRAQELMQKGAWDLIDTSIDADLDEMLTELATVKASQAMLGKRKRAIETHVKENVFDSSMKPEDCVEETQNWSIEWGEGERVQYIPREVQRHVDPGVFGSMVSLSKASVERVLPILPEDIARDIRKTAIIKPMRRLTIKPKESADGEER